MKTAYSLLFTLSFFCVILPLRINAESQLSETTFSGIVLHTVSKQEFDFFRATRRKKVALLLYPGDWDPYSVHALKVLRNSESVLMEWDYLVVVISPDRPEVQRRLYERMALPFVQLYDPEHQVARALGLMADLSSDRAAKLSSAGIDLLERTGRVQGSLPQLSLTLIHRDGIRFERWRPSEKGLLLDTEWITRNASPL
ncbi:MAG: redoxin domain-containing protein [Candidatus Methylacidiphilales bacterium]